MPLQLRTLPPRRRGARGGRLVRGGQRLHRQAGAHHREHPGPQAPRPHCLRLHPDRRWRLHLHHQLPRVLWGHPGEPLPPQLVRRSARVDPDSGDRSGHHRRRLQGPGHERDEGPAQAVHPEELHGARERHRHLHLEPRDGTAPLLRRGQLPRLRAGGAVADQHQQGRARGVLHPAGPRDRAQARQLGVRLQPRRVQLVPQPRLLPSTVRVAQPAYERGHRGRGGPGAGPALRHLPRVLPRQEHQRILQVNCAQDVQQADSAATKSQRTLLHKCSGI